MSPALNNGDYIITIKPHSLRVGFIYVIQHDRLGRIVKRLSQFTPDGLKVSGDNIASTSSDKIGLVKEAHILGHAIFAVTPRGLKKL